MKLLSLLNYISFSRYFIPVVYCGLLFISSCRKPNSSDSKNEKLQRIASSQHLPKSGRLTDNRIPLDEISFNNVIQSVDINSISNIRDIVRLQVSNDPIKSIEIIDDLPIGTKRTLLLKLAFSATPKERIEDLIQWADKTRVPEDIHILYPILNPDESLLKPSRAIQLIHDVSSPQLKKQLTEFAAWQIARENISMFSEIANYATNIPKDYQSLFIDQVAYGVTSKNPQKGFDLILSNYSNFSDGAIEGIACEVGSKCPQIVSNKVAEYVSNSGSNTLLAPFVRGWLSNDSMAASNWATSQLTGNLRDLAIVEVVKFLNSKGDYDSAKTYRDSILNITIKNQINVP